VWPSSKEATSSQQEYKNAWKPDTIILISRTTTTLSVNPMNTAGLQPQRTLNDQAILEYLSRRGFAKAEGALRAELANSISNSSAGKGRTVGLEEFADKMLTLRMPPLSLEIISAKRKKASPSEYAKGYEGLREFVNNSLDIHRPAFTPFLLPLFVHSYMDLVMDGRRDAADDFLHRFTADHEISEPYLVQHLASLRHPYHIQESEVAQRWKRERYVIRVSERAKNLLMTWLQTETLGGDTDESRAKDRMTKSSSRIYPNIPTHEAPLKLGPAPKDPKLMREVSKVLAQEDAPPKSTESGNLPEGENADVAMTDGTTTTKTTSNPTNVPTTPIIPEITPSLTAATTTTTSSDLVAPTHADLLPYSSNFKTLDLRREVEAIREAKKRIRLGPEAFVENNNKSIEKEVWKPSVCAFTIHDAGQTMTAARFSDDVTILGAGFSDSYIKLWNLKEIRSNRSEMMVHLKELISGLMKVFRNLYNSTFSKYMVSKLTRPSCSYTAETIRKMRKKTASNSIKLIGHSGPVYSISFDPIPGPSSPPRHLLSSSQDSTIRLWSLDLFKNLVVYRGHREPVWDVEWGPKGIYFASASRIEPPVYGALNALELSCVKFHPNSLYMATGSSDRTCRLWDVQGAIRSESSMDTKAHPDGKLLASAGEDQSIKIWDIGSSRLMKTMRGHQSSIYSLTFSAESTILASASSDCSIRVWDVQVWATGQIISNPSLDSPEDSLAQPGLKLKGHHKSTVKLLRRGLFGLHEYRDTPDLLLTLPTRQTPILNVSFTTRNLLLGVGPMLDPSSSQPAPSMAGRPAPQPVYLFRPTHQELIGNSPAAAERRAITHLEFIGLRNHHHLGLLTTDSHGWAAIWNLDSKRIQSLWQPHPHTQSNGGCLWASPLDSTRSDHCSSCLLHTSTDIQIVAQTQINAINFCKASLLALSDRDNSSNIIHSIVAVPSLINDDLVDIFGIHVLDNPQICMVYSGLGQHHNKSDKNQTGYENGSVRALKNEALQSSKPILSLTISIDPLDRLAGIGWSVGADRNIVRYHLSSVPRKPTESSSSPVPRDHLSQYRTELKAMVFETNQSGRFDIQVRSDGKLIGIYNWGGKLWLFDSNPILMNTHINNEEQEEEGVEETIRSEYVLKLPTDPDHRSGVLAFAPFPPLITSSTFSTATTPLNRLDSLAGLALLVASGTNAQVSAWEVFPPAPS
ncbi:hypothetical protein PSHT_10012, partial [Puccinia striiformis]